MTRLDFLRRTISVVDTVVEVGGQVQFAPTKTKMSRRAVTVPPPVMDMLAEHLHRQHGGKPPDPESLVFTAPMGGPIRRKHWRQRVWLRP